MLYSFIPPILIVLSLIGIIVFLVKKSHKVNELSDEILAGEGESKVITKIKNIKWEKAKHVLLVILEKITRTFRTLFLKLETRFSHWSNRIREKRAQKKAQQAEIVKENDIMEKLKEYKIDKKKSEVIVKKDIFEEEEKPVRPIVSDKVVSPSSRTEMKDRLEELLIERIAVNPKDIEAYERLGEYYLEIKSYTDSKECFKQILKLDPKNKNAKYRMRRLETLMSK